MTPNEETERMRKLARETLVKNGEIYEKVHGPEVVLQNIEGLKQDFFEFNRINGSSIRLDLNAIEIMLNLFIRLPFIANDMKMLHNEKLLHFNMMLSAIRNKMKKDRDDKIKASNPDLSTP